MNCPKALFLPPFYFLYVCYHQAFKLVVLTALQFYADDTQLYLSVNCDVLSKLTNLKDPLESTDSVDCERHCPETSFNLNEDL